MKRSATQQELELNLEEEKQKDMPQRDELRQVLIGVGLVLLMHLVAAIIFFIIASNSYALSNSAMLGIFGVGLSQFIYVIPTIVVTAIKRKFAIMKGVIIGAVITALLNGGCWLIVVNAFSR